MTVQCIDCQRLNLRAEPKMARMGFGRCNLSNTAGAYESVLWQRECGKFAPEEQEAARKRREWLEKQK